MCKFFRKSPEVILVASLLVLISGVVFLNVREQAAVDQSKIPEKLEQSKGFQRWITNLKNKDININADEFLLKEANEIYNTKWMKVYSSDDPEQSRILNDLLASTTQTKKTVFSPSERLILDIRNEVRDGYQPNEARLYGQLDNKIIDARVMDCSVRANCYLDRAYFIENDLLVVSELSRNIDKKDQVTPLCSADETCTYTFKEHLIDLKHNKRYIYESHPFDIVLNKLIPEI